MNLTTVNIVGSLPRCLVRTLASLACISLAMAQSAGTFTPTGDLTDGTSFPKAALLSNGKVLITGYPTIESYDGTSGTFSSIAGLPFLNSDSVTPLADGRVLVTEYGGTGAALYDPNTGAFTATGPMTMPRLGQAAILLPNGKVLIIGGYQNPDVDPVDVTTEIYDPDSGTFTASGSFLGVGPYGTATLLADGRVLVAAYYSGLAAIYDPATGAFSLTGGADGSSSAILLPNGKVLFTGGNESLTCGGKPGPGPNGVLYDPATGAFSPTAGTMTANRLDHSATLLGDGTVLLAGGEVCPEWGGPGALASAEIYNPTTDTFVATGNMVFARYSQAMVLLPSGTVLVAGGIEYGGDLAEIYHPANATAPPVLFNDVASGQAAIWNGLTGQLVSSGNPATAGDVLSMYTNNLIEGGVIPPQVAVGGRLAQILFFGDAPGYPGYFQVNFQVPSGVTPGVAVSVVLTYLGRASNAVTIGVR
jgi:uncharacterized protein (TIGR03437 family)